MAYEVKNYESLLGMKGFSDGALKLHFTLYQGYVNNVNKLLDTISTMVKEGKVAIPEFAELKRRFGWEFNGMRLHELYFGELSKNGINLDKNSSLLKRLVKDFGSYENWETEFKSVASIRGIGWAILYYDSQENRLLNVWINEHDVGHLSTAVPLLVLDVFEHAYVVDYGSKRADYISTFFENIDWSVIQKRFENVNN